MDATGLDGEGHKGGSLNRFPALLLESFTTLLILCLPVLLGGGVLGFILRFQGLRGLRCRRMLVGDSYISPS